jgi:hypothetical protein
MAELAAVSDLHLGDREEGNGSVLSSLSVCKNFIDQLADITHGCIGTLVIDGDGLEACVPSRTAEENFLHKTSVLDLYNSTIEDAQKFFSTLTSRISVDRLIWVPGNHDYSLYLKMIKLGILPNRLVSPFSGYSLRKGGAWSSKADLLGKLFGDKILDIRAAHPNYVYCKEGQDWPVAVFTHGHLFDSQVLTPSSDFLKTIGLFAETGHIFDPVPSAFDVNPGRWMEALSFMTSERVSLIWTQNLDPVKEAVYNYAERRKIHIVCGERPKESGHHVWLAALQGCGLNDPVNHHLKWYCDGFMQDWSPVLPNPRPTSYFVKGHTHFGGATCIESLDGAPFQVYDLGGWTLDAVGHKDNVPHTHALVWDEFPATPKMYAFNVGKP